MGVRPRARSCSPLKYERLHCRSKFVTTSGCEKRFGQLAATTEIPCSAKLVFCDQFDSLSVAPITDNQTIACDASIVHCTPEGTLTRGKLVPNTQVPCGSRLVYCDQFGGLADGPIFDATQVPCNASLVYCLPDGFVSQAPLAQTSLSDALSLVVCGASGLALAPLSQGDSLFAQGMFDLEDEISHTVNPPAGGVILFSPNNVTRDTPSSNYTAATGTYTAPRTGMYYISVMLQVSARSLQNPPGAANQVQLAYWFTKNGSTVLAQQQWKWQYETDITVTPPLIPMTSVLPTMSITPVNTLPLQWQGRLNQGDTIETEYVVSSPGAGSKFQVQIHFKNTYQAFNPSATGASSLLIREQVF